MTGKEVAHVNSIRIGIARLASVAVIVVAAVAAAGRWG